MDFFVLEPRFGGSFQSFSITYVLVGTQVLQSVVPIKDEEVVLGQYEGYKDDPTVPENSNTPTFASVILHIHNERWEGETESYRLTSFNIFRTIRSLQHLI